MKLAVFAYSACINPSSSQSGVKHNINDYFKHNESGHISALFAPLGKDRLDVTLLTSALFKDLSPTLIEKRRYESGALNIFSVSNNCPPFLIIQNALSFQDPLSLHTLFDMLRQYYFEAKIPITQHHYYSDSFEHYIEAKKKGYLHANWVSPTSMLSDTFKIKANTKAICSPPALKMAARPYNTPLLPEHIASLTLLLDKVISAFQKNTKARIQLEALKTRLVEISKANAFGSLNQAFTEFVSCLTENANAIQLIPKKVIPTKAQTPKTKSLFTRFRSEPTKAQMPQKPTQTPLMFILGYIDKQLHEMGLTQYLLSPVNALSIGQNSA